MKNNRLLRKIKGLMLGLFCLVVGAGSNFAAEVSYEQLEKFNDNFFDTYMETYHIPGAAVTVVQGDKVLFQKGYGYSDLEKKQAFTTDQTHFSIASVTKLFTALATMKLVEEGKIDLEQEVGYYLPDLKLNNPYKEAVTVKELLTHTAGIDSSFTEDLSYEVINVDQPHYLLEQLKKKEINVVSRPGAFIEYSSYGTVLLGAIIEEVSGESCIAYINEKIIQPLNMQQTDLLNPEVKRTKGYLYFNDQLIEGELKGYFRLYPEGGLVSTLEDMEHYLEMLLSQGQYEGKTIIDEPIIEEMFKDQASFDALLPGMGLGFAQYVTEGKRSVGHAGYATDGTLSELMIYPEDEVGTFVVVNQGSNSNIQEDYRKAFVNTFLEEETEQTDGECLTDENIGHGDKKFEGTYRFSDYPKTNLYKANTFGTGEIEIKVLDEKTICISGNDEFTHEHYEKKAHAIGKLAFEIEGENEYLVFKEDDKGKVSTLAVSSSSNHGIYERLKWYEQSKWQVPFFAVAMIIYFLQLVGIGIIFIVNRIKHNDQKTKVMSKTERLSSCLTNLIAVVSLGFFGYSMFFWQDQLRYVIPIDILISLTLPIINIFLNIALVGCMVKRYDQLIRSGEGRRGRLIYHTFYCIMSVIFIAFMNYWQFIGYRL